MQVKLSVGIAQRGGRDAALGPLDLAGDKVDALQSLRGCAVKEVPNFHHAAYCGGKFGPEIQWLWHDPAIFGVELHRATPRSGGTDVDGTTACEGSRDVGTINTH